VRAVGAAAVPVENQGVIGEIKSQAFGRLVLQRFDRIVGELFDVAAVHTDDMIVMLTPVQLEHRRSTLEMMTGDEAGRLKLGEDTVDGGKSDILVRVEQAAVNIFRGQVMPRFHREDVQNLDAGGRDLKASFPKILAFHSALP